MLFRIFFLFLIIFSTQSYADDKNPAAQINSGFLIINLEKGDEINNIRNLVLKLDDIESITHFSDAKNNQAFKLVIKLNSKHEHIPSVKQHILEFSNTLTAQTIYNSIMSALSDR